MKNLNFFSIINDLASALQAFGVLLYGTKIVGSGVGRKGPKTIRKLWILGCREKGKPSIEGWNNN